MSVTVRTTSILDEVHPTLTPLIWDDPGAAEPRLKPKVAHFIKRTIYQALERHGYTKPEKWLHPVLTGSLTTYQYADDSDCDVSLFVDAAVMPEWSRAEMIGIMIGNTDGVKIPGTPYPLQCFVVGKKLSPDDLYQPGLRSGYDIDKQHWIVPPEPERNHDVKSQENGFYAWALEMADKMERLLRYEPDKAVQFWHQIHKRRMRDQTAGKGDFAESNILYKFLSKRGLFPAISQASGEYIAKVADLQGLPGAVNVPGHGEMQFGQNPDIARIAEEYNQRNGLGPHPQDYVRVNPERAAQVAAAYDRAPHAPDDPNVAGAYEALARETRAQYEDAVRNGYQFEFYPEDRDPYPNSPREAVMDLANNRHMYVYPTETGYGSGEDNANHPLLGDSGVRWNGRPVTHNDLFRAVHDFYGHAKEGLGFRADGEDNAYRQHAAMFTPQAQQALAAETRGQNSWVNFGPYGEQNQTAGQADTVYAPQKATVLPSWAADPNLHAQQTFSRVASDLSKAVYDAIQTDGGITIGLDGTRPSSGFAFSTRKDAEEIVPLEKLTPDAIDQYLASYQPDLAQPHRYLGAWVDGDQVYLDVSQIERDRHVAEQLARSAQQLAMFDLSTFEEIPLTQPAASGTVFA